MTDREFDVVILGATGFTGRLTAAHVATTGPPGMRWAIAGRNAQKVARVREEVAPQAEVVTADVEDPSSLRELAERARVVVTTVGPYLKHGGPLVAACAEAGTDYLDLTGEPEFVDRMWLEHHATAERTGARLVHCCGFDSIPHDLGALHCVQQLPEGVPLTVRGYVRASGMFSGGTYHSAVGQFARARQMAAAHRERKRAEPRPDGRRAKAEKGRMRREGDKWAVPMPTIDPQVVARSARALERYGPDFTYGHYAALGLPLAVGAGIGVGTVMALSQLPPTRALLLKAKAAGTGPSEEQIAKGWFKVRFVGEGGGQKVVTQVSGGDPGYGDTAKMLGQAALCLAFDDVPKSAGQVTPAVAMGDALIERLRGVGITFEVLEGPRGA